MKNQCASYLCRAHLLRMMRLSQRAVDYSIKAHELGAREIYPVFWRHDKEWRDLQCRIADRGRRLFAAGITEGAGSPTGEITLRVYSALHVMYTAAVEIAHSGSLILQRGGPAPSPQLNELSKSANSMVRSCAVAMFMREADDAWAILLDHRGRRRFERAVVHAIREVRQSAEVEAKLELAIAQALGQIGEQAFEIAHAFGLCGEVEGSFDPVSESLCFAE